MKRQFLIGTVVVLGFGASGTAFAEGERADSRNPEYYFAFDEVAMRRDSARIREFYVAPETEAPAEATETGMVFLGGAAEGGFVGFWDGGTTAGGDAGGAPSSWLDRMEIGFDWRPYATGARHRDPRRIGRFATAGDVDQVGVRADLTALLPTGPAADGAASAWRITGMLGSTSLSLTSDLPVDPRSGTNFTEELYWDIGVGWSSGPMSLSAGYETTYRDVAGVPAGMAVLSFGADYAVLPGLSVYGEFNVVDDPAAAEQQGLGTVIILGTGVNF